MVHMQQQFNNASTLEPHSSHLNIFQQIKHNKKDGPYFCGLCFSLTCPLGYFVDWGIECYWHCRQCSTLLSRFSILHSARATWLFRNNAQLRRAWRLFIHSASIATEQACLRALITYNVVRVTKWHELKFLLQRVNSFKIWTSKYHKIIV